MIDLEDVETTTRQELLKTWRALFGNDPPKSLSLSLMRKITANELQLQKHGGLDQQSLRTIKRLQGQARNGGETKTKPISRQLKTGSRLMREWSGVTHIVEVNDAGFTWQNKSYRSLSAIAKSITGAHWSGPRFFGLNNPQENLRGKNG